MTVRASEESCKLGAARRSGSAKEEGACNGEWAAEGRSATERCVKAAETAEKT